MARLEDLTKGAQVKGIGPDGPVEVLDARWHGSNALELTYKAPDGKPGRDAGRIADEVLSHLTPLKRARVTVTLEIQAEAPDGVPDNVVRTVTENCKTLRFTTSGFEED
jgi:hypothetical protein